MGIREWRMSQTAELHMLRKHGVTRDEVNEVMADAPQIRKGKRRSHEQRYYVVGRTCAGRELLVVFRIFEGVAEIITAWDA